MNAQYLFEKWCDLSDPQKDEFHRMVKAHERFAKNLDAVATALEKYGSEAVEMALKGDTVGAKAAVRKHLKAKGEI